MELSSPCPQGMWARFFKMPAGLEPARGRASSGRAASVASRRGHRQAAEAGAYLRSKYADVPPPRASEFGTGLKRLLISSQGVSQAAGRKGTSPSALKTTSIPFRSCGGIIPILSVYQHKQELFHRNLYSNSHIFRWKNVVHSHIFRGKRSDGLTDIESRSVPSCRQKRNVPRCHF